MKKSIKILSFLGLLTLGAQAVSAQGMFGIGFTVEPMICLTDLAPRLDAASRTAPRFKEVFNYSTGIKVDYQLESGLAFTSGINLSRKRFGFQHKEGTAVDAISLWGHSEYHTLELPLQVSFVVISSSKPFYEIAPFAGLSFGGDFSSYRNLTREDENFSYTYLFDHDNYQKTSFISTIRAGLMFKTIINQLGVIHCNVTLATDLTKLPSFDYEIALNDISTDYSQKIRMNYISAGITYYFSTWEVFNGQFMKRSFY